MAYDKSQAEREQRVLRVSVWPLPALTLTELMGVGGELSSHPARRCVPVLPEPVLPEPVLPEPVWMIRGGISELLEGAPESFNVELTTDPALIE